MKYLASWQRIENGQCISCGTQQGNNLKNLRKEVRAKISVCLTFPRIATWSIYTIADSKYVMSGTIKSKGLTK